MTNLRCIESAALEFSPELNLIAGENGAGKTSILEAIFLLGRGRSFRTRNSERLIRHGQPSLTVFGRTDDSPPRQAGVEIGADGGTRARINGENARSLLELSGVVAVQAIDPEIHKLVDQGPERRRRWLDWLVFHVEPSFGIHWARYSRALKQRNAALKVGAMGIESWDEELISQGEAITEARQRILERLAPDCCTRPSSASAVSTCRLDSWRGGRQGRRSSEALAAHARARSAARHDHRRAPPRGRHSAPGPSGRARDALARAAEADRRRDDRLAAATAAGRARHASGAACWTIPRPSWTRKICSVCSHELSSLRCQMIATSLTPETALFQAPKATFHVEQGRVIRL